MALREEVVTSYKYSASIISTVSSIHSIQHLSTMSIQIPSTYCGPPNSGNGGYTCGLIAEQIGDCAEVTLRKPPPLDTDLEWNATDEGLQLMQGELLIAEGMPTTLEMEIPLPPTLSEAEAAVPHYIGFQKHAFPTCFVCGPQRSEGEGLRIFTGPLGKQAGVAAPWTPTQSLADDEGKVRTRYVWAALDCPGAYGIYTAIQEHRVVVLGRLTACITTPVHADKTYLVTGWPMGNSGRKHFAGTAIFTAEGELCAYAKAIWFEVQGTF